LLIIPTLHLGKAENLILPSCPPPCRRESMKVLGCDVGKGFVILCDGENYYFYGSLKEVKGKLPRRVKILNKEEFPELLKNNLVVLEQTGFYGVRFAKIFQDFGAIVKVADGKEFKRFRGGRVRDKDDYIDAFHLREMFFDDEFSKFITPFQEEKVALRSLVRYKKKLEKDLTRHVNRLRQVLAAVFHDKDYFDLSRSALFKKLPEIKEELQKKDTYFKLIVLSEIEKVEACLKAKREVEKELTRVVKKHPDYEILSSFPHLGDMTIATMIAYYYDVNNFKTADEFIAYLLMGVRKEQSGKSLNRKKTDKTRSEVKANLFMCWVQTKKRNSVLLPLRKYLESRISGGHNHKKRFVKWADYILRLAYRALKLRLTFEEVVKLAIEEKEKQSGRLEEKVEKIELTEKEYTRLYRTKRLLAVYQDISARLKEREEKKRQKRQRRRSAPKLLPDREKCGIGEKEVSDGANKEGNSKENKRATKKRRSRAPDSYGGEVHRSVYGSSQERSLRGGKEDNPL